MNRQVPLAFIVLIGAFGEAQARSLPPAAFAELPKSIVAELEQRGCQIPQIQRHKRINVIQGDFVRSGEQDWAVLCRSRDETRLRSSLPVPNNIP